MKNKHDFPSLRNAAVSALVGLGIAAGVIYSNSVSQRPGRNTAPLLEDLRSNAVSVECLSSQKSADALSRIVGRGIGQKVASTLPVKAKDCQLVSDKDACVALSTHLLVENALLETAPRKTKASYFIADLLTPGFSGASSDLTNESYFGSQATKGIEAMRNACKK